MLIKVDGSFPPVLNKLSLEISTGDFICLIGANGSGKSTLIKLLCGILPVKGTRKLNIKKTQIAYVPQNAMPDIKCPLTVKEVIMLGVAARNGVLGKFSKNDFLKTDSLMQAFGLTGASGACGKISGGEMQKMQIARALMQNPKLLLLDEPFTNLDIHSKQIILKHITDYFSCGGIAVVLATHETENLPKECNKVLKIVNGEILTA